MFKRLRSKADELLEIPEPDRRRESDEQEKVALIERVDKLEERVDEIATYLDIEAETAAGVQAQTERE